MSIVPSKLEFEVCQSNIYQTANIITTIIRVCAHTAQNLGAPSPAEYIVQYTGLIRGKLINPAYANCT